MQNGSEPITLHLQYDDNKLLHQLYGEYDAHIIKIEENLDVSVHCRGNKIAIAGAPDRVHAAETVLNALYDRLEKGQNITGNDVDAALRVTQQHKSNSPKKALQEDFNNKELAIQTKNRLVTPRSRGQADYLRGLQKHKMVFGVGPAGSGKTYLAVAKAVEQLCSGRVNRLILSRPAVEAGEHLGFLPGDLKHKVDPYLRPLYDALYDMLPTDWVNRKMESEEIEIAPLAYMRGRTLKNAFVILDEAQNTTAAQMKMFVSRLGENSRMVINGDLSQVDLPKNTPSGLAEACRILKGIEGIYIQTFNETDIVRDPLVARIVKAYKDADA